MWPVLSSDIELYYVVYARCVRVTHLLVTLASRDGSAFQSPQKRRRSCALRQGYLECQHVRAARWLPSGRWQRSSVNAIQVTRAELSFENVEVGHAGSGSSQRRGRLWVSTWGRRLPQPALAQPCH